MPGHVLQVLLMQAMDDFAVNAAAQDELAKCYPDAKQAQIKVNHHDCSHSLKLLQNGGHYLPLSRPDDVALHIRVCCASDSEPCHT